MADDDNAPAIAYWNVLSKNKIISLTKQRMRKDFSSIEYSGSWFERPRVLRLTQFLAGGSKWFKACVGAHNLLNRSWSDWLISSVNCASTSCESLAQSLRHSTQQFWGPTYKISYGNLTMMPKLPSTYDRRLIYKTSYPPYEIAPQGFSSIRFTCKNVRSSEIVFAN